MSLLSVEQEVSSKGYLGHCLLSITDKLDYLFMPFVFRTL